MRAMFISRLNFLTKQSGKDVKVTADFSKYQDLEAIRAAIAKGKDFSAAQKSARDILRNLLVEVDYYDKQKSFASNGSELLNLQRKGLSEFATILVFKINEKVVGAALFHATWKRNVYLDWMAALPEFLKDGKKIAGLGGFMVQGVLYIARQLGANLTFIESTKGAAATYKKNLILKEECDFILLTWNPYPANGGWQPCPQIYSLANRDV